MSEEIKQKFESARLIVESDPSLASLQLHEVLSSSYPNDSESLKTKEAALDLLTSTLIKQEDSASLRKLLTDLRPWFAVIPKAKTAKVIRSLIDSISKVPNSNQTLVCILLCSRCSYLLLYFI
jgi:26S proteasome regulatory subunit N6